VVGLTANNLGIADNGPCLAVRCACRWERMMGAVILVGVEDRMPATHLAHRQRRPVLVVPLGGSAAGGPRHPDPDADPDAGAGADPGAAG